MQSDESVMQDKHVSSLKRREIKNNWSKKYFACNPQGTYEKSNFISTGKNMCFVLIEKNGIWQNIDKNLSTQVPQGKRV